MNLPILIFKQGFTVNNRLLAEKQYIITMSIVLSL